MAAMLNTPKAQLRYMTSSYAEWQAVILTFMQGVVGSVTGSADWQNSAETDKQQGIDTMKAAGENRDPNQSGFGKVEEMAGKAVGCEGMENEGEQSKQS